MNPTARRTTLAKLLHDEDLAALLVTSPINVSYLTGFSGDSSYLVLTRDRAILVHEQLLGEAPQQFLSLCRAWIPRVSQQTAIEPQRIRFQNGRSAVEDDEIRQQIAQFAIEVAAKKYNGLRSLTKRLKGQQPGAESSIGKLNLAGVASISGTYRLRAAEGLAPRYEHALRATFR